MSGGNKIICGDALEVLKTMPDEPVHCCVTSPPYWGLRDYGIEGQLGLEKTPEEYVAKLVEIFREVRRVLRKDGVMFLNMGDSYCGSGQGWGQDPVTISKLQGGNIGSLHSLNREPLNYRIRGLKPKDLIGMPWRVAFALQADGWWLRSDIIWAKPNPMPESVRDRPTKSHEYLFLLTKSAKYYYDQEAIREKDNPDGRTQTVRKQTGRYKNSTQNIFQDAEHERWSGSRNARSVWTIATQPFPEAHFATFPEKLVEPCIKAGTSEKGCCPKCGSPWVRVLERRASVRDDAGRTHSLPEQRMGKTPPPEKGWESKSITLGWRPSCECYVRWDGIDPVIHSIVLDPFIGSGTTALVARGLGRNYIGIDLNPQYVAMANRRLAEAMPFFNTKGE